MRYKIIIFGLAITVFLMNCCGYFYGFGIRSDSPCIKFKQTQKCDAYGEYEFETVLFRAEDSSFKIILQHPIYLFPLAIPEVLISQVGVISQNNKPIDFKFIKIEISHFDESGQFIKPSKTMTIPESGEINFYVVQYESDTFPKKKVKEKITIEFIAQDKTHSISFDEDVFWVKRACKLSAAMSI